MSKLLLFSFAVLFTVSCQPETDSPGGAEELPSLPENLKIAFNVMEDNRTNNYDIYIMNADGSEPKNLSNSPGVDWVYYSYDNTLFFVSDRDEEASHLYLYSMNSDGSDIKKISDFRVADSWMSGRKNGTELIVKPHSSVDSTSFYIIDLKGEIINKIPVDLPYMQDPEFSTDGNRIVFRGSESPFIKDSGYLDELYVIDTDGSNMEKITTYPASDSTAAWWSYHAGPPRWKDISNTISFTSSQKYSSSIFQVSPDGKMIEQITPDSTYEGWHSWTDDEEWLVYTRSVINGGNINFDIFIKHSESDYTRRLTTEPRMEQAPVIVETK